ncbi:MAG: hypothetical protein ACXWW5_05710, partial [Actinomycetota bacterium]
MSPPRIPHRPDLPASPSRPDVPSSVRSRAVVPVVVAVSLALALVSGVLAVRNASDAAAPTA